MRSSIAPTISRSIKEGKWLYIEYENLAENKTTYFWISIFDIDPVKRKLSVYLFNQEYSLDVRKGFIYFNQILSAQLIEGTTAPICHDLIERIVTHYQDYAFLEYSGINERVLTYYQQCYEQDRSGVVQQYKLVEGIDSDMIKGKPVHLSPKTFEDYVRKLKLNLHLSNQKYDQKLRKMSINVLAVHTSAGLFPIVYRDVLLDVEKKTLVASEALSFNLKVDTPDGSMSLHRLLDGNVQDFIDNYETEPEIYIQMIQDNLRKHEQLDERPYLFQFQINIAINIQQEYAFIQKHFENQTLCAPLKAFFGHNEKQRQKRNLDLLFAGSQINIDQIRVIYNALYRNIVYVQGPPGTGKTSTIINVILSCFLNNISSLIVSNNNEAIQNIYRKCSTFVYEGKQVYFPVLRLGSREHIASTLNHLVHNWKTICQIEIDGDEKKRIHELEAKIRLSNLHVRDACMAHEEKAELEEQIESLYQIIATIQSNTQLDDISKNMAILGIKAEIQKLDQLLSGYKDQRDWLSAIQFDKEIVNAYLYEKSLACFRKLNLKKYQCISKILLIDDEEERLFAFLDLIGNKDTSKLLIECFPFIISTNISCGKLGEADIMFDLMIMDEASQCSNALALLPMARCKRALFVGDQNQLQPVILLSSTKNTSLIQSLDIPSQYDYKNNSILTSLLKIDTLSKFILLREHYRCNDKIINFANEKYYDRELKLSSSLHNVDALKLIHVNSSAHNSKNICMEEFPVILDEILKDNYKNVAIITPFRNQADYLEEQLGKQGLGHIKVGTIHTFQGDEKDKIILSCGLSKTTLPGSFRWLKNNQQLLNVATTRAKEKLVLVCDVNVADDLSQGVNNDFMDLIRYMKSDGEYQVSYHENELFDSKVKNFKYFNTAAEQDFLQTLMHFKSVYGQIAVKSKIKVSDVLKLSTEDRSLFLYGNQAHFDFVLYDLSGKPLAAVEVSGVEHYSLDKVKLRDKKKQLICQQHDLKLITIKNDYVRRYSFIKDTLLQALRG